VPQVTALGYCTALPHGVSSQLSPSATQVPQLGLQHTWPELQVLRPQLTALAGFGATLQENLEQVPPGGVHTPQLGLQHV
jgi:hypothetical protein